jgi:hypothetical protein
MGRFSLFMDEADIDFTIDVLPFRRGGERFKKFVEWSSLERSILKPSQKVERFFGAEISAMVQPPCNTTAVGDAIAS